MSYLPYVQRWGEKKALGYERTDVTWGYMFISSLCTKCMDLAHFDANFKGQFVTVKFAASCDFFFLLLP